MAVAPPRSCRPRCLQTEPAIRPTAQPSPSLEELIAASARGDEQAFYRLYRATSDVLFGVAVRILKRSELAEEVLQESFVSVWRHAARYDRARGAPMTWLIRIVRNQSFDWIHPSQADGHERLHGVSTDWLEYSRLDDAHQQGKSDALEWLADAHQADRVARCLGELDARQRQSIVLVFFHGLSHGELARHLQQPLGTVKAWVRRGLKSLRSCLIAQA